MDARCRFCPERQSRLTKWNHASALAQVFAHMQAAAASDAACAPNVITYSALMTACCAGGRPDKAYEVFQVLVPYTIQPKSIHRLHVLLA